MAIGDRSKHIRQNVQDILGDTAGVDAAKSARIYDAVNRIQREIAETFYCLEGVEEIELEAGQELYDFPDEMLSERKLIPNDASTPLQKIDFDTLDTLKRLQANEDNTDVTSDDIFYYYKWQGQFGFLRCDGSLPSGVATITVYYWRGPDEDTEVISDSVDPVVHRRWDTALFYGAAAELTHNPKWYALYEGAKVVAGRSERASTLESGRIPSTRDYD